MEIQKKHGKTSIVVICCDCSAISIVNLWKRYAKKLRSMILLQFELITFRFGYMITLNILMFMISGLLDVSLSPNTNIIYLWRPLGTSNNSRKPQIV